MFGLIYPYGIVLQAIAILHFVRRRPETYWLWIILMFGGVGALIYIFVEVLPDAGLLRGAFQVFPRRKRIKELEGLVLDNPSVGNYEELGDLYLDDQQFARARECFDKVLAKTPTIDPFYRRALSELALQDFPAAAADLEQVVTRDPKYDYQRAAGLRAHVLAKLGQREKPPTACSPTSCRHRRCRKPNTTMPASSPLMAGATRRANGPSAFFERKRRCPTTSGGESDRGSGRRRRCSRSSTRGAARCAGGARCARCVGCVGGARGARCVGALGALGLPAVASDGACDAKVVRWVPVAQALPLPEIE